MAKALGPVFILGSLIVVFAGFGGRQPSDLTAEAQTGSFGLAGATFLGGAETDDAYEPSLFVAEDSSVYVSGFTSSRDFPVTPGAYNTGFNGGVTDRFISRLTHEMSEMLESTYIGSAGAQFGFIGGNGDDFGHAIGVDGDGNVFIAGYTDSADYPVTKDGYDTRYNGGRDVFISKFDSKLTTILASTFVGGSGDEGYRWPRIDLVVSAEGDVIVTGITHSLDFPVTANAYGREFSGGSESGDAFVVIFDNDLSTLKASTYLGGSKNEWRVSVHSDDGRILVCGETESSDFPTTAAAYDRTLNVLKDVFVARFDADLSTLEASTLFGGSKLDEALDIGVASSGDVVLTGYTESEDLPVTAGSYRTTWSGGKRDGYAAIFDSELGTLVSSTMFGGSGVDFPRGLALDAEDNVYLTGNTTSPDFPVTETSFSAGYRGGSSRGDVFILVFDGGLREVKYSTLTGGSSEDTGFGIDVDARGRVFVVGSTSSPDFEMTVRSFDDSFNGGANDNFVLSWMLPMGAQAR